MIVPRYFSPSEIAEADILEICALKNQSWPHSMDSQIAWWNRNTHSDDILVMLKDEGVIHAFLRLRSRPVLVGSARLDAVCATEVCVAMAHQGRGLGAWLLNLAVARIKKLDTPIGYLLCRDSQEPFYAACGWSRAGDSFQIESSLGVRRSLSDIERCMTIDPQQRLNGPVVLFGDVF